MNRRHDSLLGTCKNSPKGYYKGGFKHTVAGGLGSATNHPPILEERIRGERNWAQKKSCEGNSKASKGQGNNRYVPRNSKKTARPFEEWVRHSCRSKSQLRRGSCQVKSNLQIKKKQEAQPQKRE